MKSTLIAIWVLLNLVFCLVNIADGNMNHAFAFGSCMIISAIALCAEDK